MNPRAIDTAGANNRRRHHTSDGNRRSTRTTPGPPQRPGHSGTGPQDVYTQTMRRLRVYIALLTSILLASIARAVVDGLTPGLALALALTAVLLVAALGLWRVGSHRRPDDTSPPRTKG
jgi:hypothetical protein